MAISRDQVSAIKSAYASAASSGGGGNAVQKLAGDIYRQHTGTASQSANPTTAQSSTQKSTGVNQIMENQSAASGVIRSDAQGWNNGRIDSRSAAQTTGTGSTGGSTTSSQISTQPSTQTSAQTSAKTSAKTSAQDAIKATTPLRTTQASSEAANPQTSAQQSVANGAVPTTYTDASGNVRTGYIINGTTYKDVNGKTPVDMWSVVDTASGKYIKTPDGSMTYEDYLASQLGKEQEAHTASGSTTSRTHTSGSNASGSKQITYTDSRGQNETVGYYINGKYYKDPEGKEEVPVGSYVTDDKGRKYSVGYGNQNWLVYSPLDEDYYDYMTGVNNTKEIEFVNPVTGKVNYLVANPEQGYYLIYDSTRNSTGYIDSAGVFHSSDPNSEYSQKTSQAAIEAAQKQGYSFNGDGTVKIARGNEMNMERAFALNRFSDALENGEDATEILASLGVTPENAQPGTPIDEYFKELAAAKAAGGTGSSGALLGAAAGASPAGGYGGGGGGGTGSISYGGSGGGSGGISISNSSTSNYGFPGGANRVDIPESTSYIAGAPDLKPYLDAWQNAAQTAAEQRVDYTTSKGINDLVRAQEDAEREFRAQQEQISADEARARDNQVLYAEARGDRGGIGAAQYSNIANTAAINRQNVREQQTKLATDTWRQIADLRAQGEYEKADAVLEIAQTYLSNLMELEQWAANYNLSAAQFEESIREWEKNFQLSVAELTGSYNGQQTLAAKNADRSYALQEAGITGYYNGEPTYAREQGEYNQAQNERSVLASAGSALLNAGIMPSDSQLKAMGLTAEDAQALLYAAQAAATAGSGNGTPASYTLDDFLEWADAHGGEAAITSTMLKRFGLTGYDAEKVASQNYPAWKQKQKQNTYQQNWNTVSEAAKRILTQAAEEAAAGATMGKVNGKNLSMLDIATTIWANDPNVAGNYDVLDQIAGVINSGKKTT